RAAAAVRVHHVERLRVPRPDHPLEPRAHVHQVALLGGGGGGGVVGENAGADGHRLDGAKNPPLVGAALPAHREAALSAVAVGPPRRLLQQRPPLLACTWCGCFSHSSARRTRPEDISLTSAPVE
ncbi:Os02g0709701, partial [Oryza sativa Japonica Group]